jgi:UPF0755 protein
VRRLRIVILILFLLIIPVVGLVVWARQEINAPHLHSHENDYIEIPRGSTPDEIAGKLGEMGVIKREWLFRLYIRYSGLGPRLKAGEYRFPSPISPLAVLEKLEGGEQRLSRFTVIEGWTRWDIAEEMARIPELGLKNTDEALALMDDVSLIQDLQVDAQNLEGYLYPDTYNFPPETTAKEMVAAMVKRFRQTWEERFAERARSTNQSVNEIMTVASLIETEAKLKEERSIVASVIYNRLGRKMPLGIDSTIIYASKLAGKWKNDGNVYQSDIDRDSPYNTRKVIGLPPGPVGSPGASSIEAALNPASTDYLYYVREPSRDDGAHNFYSNEADFQRGHQKLREWRRSQSSNHASQ